MPTMEKNMNGPAYHSIKKMLEVKLKKMFQFYLSDLPTPDENHSIFSFLLQLYN